MLPLAGFTVGWVLSERSGWLLASQEQPSESETVEQPLPQNTSLPSEDVDGSDIPGLSRYPGSVRIEYLRESQGEVIWTEVEYLTEADLSQVREFYRDAFRSEDWSVNDVGYAQNAWIFFIVDGEREVFVEIKPRGGIVEVDIEQTEPKPEEPQQTDNGNGNNDQSGGDRGDDSNNASNGSGNGGSQSQSQESQAPANTEQAAPTQAPVAAPVEPAPVYDDDLYDDDDGYDDDLYDD